MLGFHFYWRLFILKKFLFVLCCIFVFTVGAALAADTQKVLEEADRLIQAKQYSPIFFNARIDS